MKYNKNEVTGKMRDRIILQNVNRSRSLTGFASESWADIATIWAFAESKLPGSNETIIEGKNTAKNICDFTIRYNSSITEESRVVWGDKLYQVKNLKVSHDRRFISFQGVFYDSYILTGVNVAASVNGIGSTSANLKLIMSVIGQANAISSTFGELTVFQQGVVEVAASVNALGNTSANLTKVISISGDLAGSAFVEANASIVQNISASVNADANILADLKLTKTLESTVNATATATSILDVVTQGIVSLDASVTATGEITANLLRIATLASSSSTAADTSAVATLTKVLEATATATAETNASAQLTIPVNASATATAETSANAQLSYTVNAEATATAETTAEAQIVRIISAEATATAESSAEASFGVTFAANVEGTANVDNATIARAATMVASVTGQATVTGATLDVAAPLLLDLYPNAAAAYSLRKLRTAYTGSAVRVRASTSGAEGDVSFDVNSTISASSTVTVTAVGTSGLSIGQQVTFSTFWNAGGSNQNVFVTTWYDQSTNAINTSQSTQSSQPQIVSSGSILRTNGKPSVLFDGTNDFLATTGTPFSATENTLIAVSRQNAIVVGYRRLFCVGLFSSGRYLGSNAGSDDMLPIFNNGILTGFGGVAISQNISIMYNNGTNGILWQNGMQILTKVASNASYGNQNIFLGWDSAQAANESWNGIGQEFIFYPTSQSSNVNQIGTNINTYYGIY